MSRWIWFPLVQHELDKFVDTQNNHHIWHQSNKNLPNGGTPNEFYRHPNHFGGSSCLIPIDLNVIDKLLEEAEEGHCLMWYVDEGFEEIANEAYVAVGKPIITLHSAWKVFCIMVVYIVNE